MGRPLGVVGALQSDVGVAEAVPAPTNAISAVAATKARPRVLSFLHGSLFCPTIGAGLGLVRDESQPL